MLRGLFPRLFGQYREGGVIVGKWSIGASGAPTRVDAESHVKLSLTRDGAGTYSLTLDGGARNMVLLNAYVVAKTDPTDVTDHMRVNPDAAIVTSTGVVSLVTITGDGSEAIGDPVNGDELHAVLYINK